MYLLVSIYYNKVFEIIYLQRKGFLDFKGFLEGLIISLDNLVGVFSGVRGLYYKVEGRKRRCKKKRRDMKIDEGEKEQGEWVRVMWFFLRVYFKKI